MIVFGAFCIFVGGAIASEMPAMYGVDFIVAGFTSLLMILCGLFCFAVGTEM
ncbi:hypothetical protein uav_025 [Pseudomonas phage UAVern]|uniref:Uncharacterized protein n=1 Tax=Pseudomonas phage UAVern TaxID=2856997 RepID=A0A975UWQ6_9CAUD|nr:hypothetical protein uav_025 [Pseudomonas phage UAVern]